jgi:5-methyltetrahydrofolate--homocysteine methyltransferase
MDRGILQLVEEEYVVLDGGMGTLLQASGLSSDHLPEEWNVSHPDAVSGVHLSYFRAGAQIVETNTFGGTQIKLGMKGKAGMMKKLNSRGARLAFEALKLFKEDRGGQSSRFVAGSIGPTGQMVGVNITEEEVKGAFSSQAAVLAENGVDLFMVETMMDLNEALLALRAIKEETDLPVFVSLVFNLTKKGEYRTLFGNTVVDSAARLLDEGADAIGTNCGLIDGYVDVISQMRALTDFPLVLYPNAGNPKVKEGKTVFDQTPEDMIAFLDREIEAGATIVGGCCGTTPEYTKLIAGRIKGKKRKK